MNKARIREQILAAYGAALAAVDPQKLTADAVAVLPHQAVRVLALGKAAPAMARGAASRRPTATLVISDHIEPVPNAEVMVGDHPLPGARSVEAGVRALAFATAIPSDELALFLISGGGSALAEVPAGELDLEDLTSTGSLLMSRGIAIEQTNTVRRHLSQLKNGGLLAARGPGPSLTLVLSDVVDGPASAVASGPTLPDESTPADALEIVSSLAGIPHAVVDHLRTSRPTPIAPSDHITLATHRTAAAGAAEYFAASQVPHRVADRALAGESAAEAAAVCDALSESILVASGETTVDVTGPGIGGRNQSAALAASIRLGGGGPAMFAALATDGVDGPTDAAGAIVDDETSAHLRQAGVDPEAALEADDAYPALDAVGALWRTGPSGTNVGDLWFGWKED